MNHDKQNGLNSDKKKILKSAIGSVSSIDFDMNEIKNRYRKLDLDSIIARSNPIVFVSMKQALYELDHDDD